MDLGQKETLLRQVMQYLCIPPAPDVNTPRDLLDWAVQHWNIHRVLPDAIRTE